MFKQYFIMIFVFIALFVPQTVPAGLSSTALRELSELLIKKGSQESAEVLSKRITTLAAKYGDDVIEMAVRKAGPQTFRIVEKAGTQGDAAINLLAKYGDRAVLIAEKPSSLKLFSQFGDDAAEAMIKHGNNADTLITTYGQPAAGALAKVSRQNGRRLTQMSTDGTLQKLGRTDEFLAVIEKFGDKGADFIWRNKGSLIVGTVATTFLLQPEPFIDGIKSLGSDIVVTTGDHVLSKLPWTLITVIVIGFLVILFRNRLFSK